MSYIKKFKSFESVTILDDDIRKILPKKVRVFTNRGKFDLKISEVTREVDIIRVSYQQSIYGEPDNLMFDFHFVKEQKGLKILVDVTYGDFMASEFSVSKPNKVSVINYNGYGSKLDPESHFGFSKKTLQNLISFLNRFGFELRIEQFKFIDEYLDTYHQKDNISDIPKAKE